MHELAWRRPTHTRWLLACSAGLLLAIVAGGFSIVVVALFLIIFGVGFALLALDAHAAGGPGRPERDGGDAVGYPDQVDADSRDGDAGDGDTGDGDAGGGDSDQNDADGGNTHDNRTDQTDAAGPTPGGDPGEGDPGEEGQGGLDPR